MLYYLNVYSNIYYIYIYALAIQILLDLSRSTTYCDMCAGTFNKCHVYIYFTYIYIYIYICNHYQCTCIMCNVGHLSSYCLTGCLLSGHVTVIDQHGGACRLATWRRIGAYIYMKPSQTGHLHRSTTPLYRSLNFDHPYRYSNSLIRPSP